MEEQSNLMENRILEITERQVNPTHLHHVKENETEESLSNYILSSTGNGTFTGRMKDEGRNSCVPIDSYENKTGALREDIKKRGPDIRLTQYQDKSSNYYQYQNLQKDCRMESVHNVPYQNSGDQHPQHITNKTFLQLEEQQEIEDLRNNNIRSKEHIFIHGVKEYSGYIDESKTLEDKTIVLTNETYHQINVNDQATGGRRLYEVPFQDRIPSVVVDEPSTNRVDLKTRNEILEQNEIFPNIIQVHGNERILSSSRSIDEGYASTELIEMVDNKHDAKSKHAFRSSTITKPQLSEGMNFCESSSRRPQILRSKSVLDDVDAYEDVQRVKTAHGGDGKDMRFVFCQSPQSGHRQTECGKFKELPDQLPFSVPFSRSPIGTAIRNDMLHEAQMQSRFISGHSPKNSNIVFTQSRRISPSPLIMRTNYNDVAERQTSDLKTERFPLQDPPRKIKRQLSNEFEGQSKFVSAEEVIEDSMTPVQETGTPKRLKPSTYQDLPQNTCAFSSPHIRTSSVIKTPTKKGKDDNIFVFPDTAPKHNPPEYKFYVSQHDNHDKSFKPDKEKSGYNRTLPTISQFHEPYRPTPVTPQKGYNYLPSGPAKHGLYFGQKASPEKRGPFRSQSNIEDQSPHKLSAAELDKIRYLRSISLPVSEYDQRFQRSMERQESAYHYVNDVGARRQLFSENRLMSTANRGPWNFDRLQSLDESGFTCQQRMSKINGPLTMWNGQCYDQYVQPVPHPHICSCCSTFSRHQPLTADVNKRRQGDIDVRIQCSGIAKECQDISQQLQFLNHTSNHDSSCDCKRIEEDVLQLARDAYSKIPKDCYTLSEQRQRDSQIQDTNDMVLEAIKVALRMKQLCNHGRSVSRIYNGSVVIRLNCPTLNSLEDLWLRYKSGELQSLINSIFITSSILVKNNAKLINLSVTVLKDEYRMCQAELMSSVLQSSVISQSKNTSPLKRSPDKRAAKSAEDLLRIPDSPKSTMIKTRSSSTPILLCHSPLGSPMDNSSPNTSAKRERKFSFGDQPRRAFQDLNSPRSPSLFNLEEIRQIVESPQFDLDEDDQENISVSFHSRGSNSRHGSPYSPLVSPKSPNCSPLSPRYSPR